MPPSKRKSVRRKAEPTVQEAPLSDALDSSPTTRPSAKKRKVDLSTPVKGKGLKKPQTNGARITRKERSATPELLAPNENEVSDAEDDSFGPIDLVELVISNLTVSKEPISVARDHANELETRSVNAFAKIAGKEWTYYVMEQTVNIGRPPDDKTPQHALTPGASSPIQDLKDQFPVHIDLGPSKIVSRHHASISYDGDGWILRVNGRNGVRINNMMLKRGDRQYLHSGAVIEIAGTQMMFVLPNEKEQIDEYYINRAKAVLTGEDPTALSDRDTETEKKVSEGVDDILGFPSLAPAPADFRRTTTPPPSDHRPQRSVFDTKPTTSPIYGRGMMMESTQEIDYARDSAKDLKPPHSYAWLIAQAIFSSPEEKLTLSAIYSYIAEHYAFYRHANSGWQNSIRHNLSLNKAFQKVPRRTDEPGKGMKWQIAPENREEYRKKMAKRGVNASSNPSSPASAKDSVNPNFRGPNGQNLGYDVTMVNSFSARVPEAGNVTRGPVLNMSFPPYPPLGSGNAPHLPGPPQHPSSQPPPHASSTPIRSRPALSSAQPDQTNIGLEDSPLPQYPASRLRPGPFYSQPNAQNSPANANPTLSSSYNYMDTPFHTSQHTSSYHNMSTPAPLKQNPRLAPPSALHAPSMFMPESSPAGPGLHWKGIFGSTTPAIGSALPADMSPAKEDPSSPVRAGNGRLDLDRQVMSSSPPPMDAVGSGSPSKPGPFRARSGTLGPSSAVKTESDQGARSVSADPHRNGVGSLQERNGNGRIGSIPPLGFGPPTKEEVKKDESEEEDGGFDLAKGFAPISSFSQRGAGGR